jgi:hypothetical protein
MIGIHWNDGLGLVSMSHPTFKIREKPHLDETGQETYRYAQRNLEFGQDYLRKLNAAALTAEGFDMQQFFLKEAHQLAALIAEEIITQSFYSLPQPLGASFENKLIEMSHLYKEDISFSNYSTAPQISINLLRDAAEDMLIRVEEVADSLSNPNLLCCIINHSQQ